MALHNSGIRARCHVSIRQSPSLCNAILNTSPCLLAIWSWRTNMFLPSSWKDFNCRGHLIVKKWQQKQMYFYVSLNRFNMMRVNFTGQSLHQCIIGNRNMHMSVLNGALWDMWIRFICWIHSRLFHCRVDNIRQSIAWINSQNCWYYSWKSKQNRMYTLWHGLISFQLIGPWEISN